MTKVITFTSAQVQNFIFFFDGDDATTPKSLIDFYDNHSEEVYNKKKNWIFNLDNLATQWILKEMKSFIIFLEQEIINYNNKTDIHCDYPKYNKIRIMLCKRIISKLS